MKPEEMKAGLYEVNLGWARGEMLIARKQVVKAPPILSHWKGWLVTRIVHWPYKFTWLRGRRDLQRRTT